MNKSKGFAPLIALAVIAGAFVVGLIFQKATKIIDHPLEQISEKALEAHGIEIDFSEDKKNKLKGK